MLANLDLVFEGSPHCGMDDTRNIHRIFERMAADGFRMEANTILSAKKRSNSSKWINLRKL